MKSLLLRLLIGCGLLLPAAALAKVRLPALLGPNMVVQQRSQVALWGWARAGSAVSVSASWDKKPTPPRPTRRANGP
ncbi:MAG: hypothetical protein WKG07_00830 [Hymenobacter sp.]